MSVRSTCNALLQTCLVAVFTILLGGAALAVGDPGGAEDEICGTRGGIAVYYEDTLSSNRLVIICRDELKKMSCQPLAIIRNYLFYTLGYCFTNPAYQKIFPNPGCDPKRNDEIFKIWEPIKDMVLRIKDMEVQNDCFDPYAAYAPQGN